jgi:hypothetical protein
VLAGLVLTSPNGAGVGSFQYDPYVSGSPATGFFILSADPPGSTVIGTLTDGSTFASGIAIELAHISGRPDTPCRFTAAVLARDAGYDLGDTGFRKNALGQELYQVNISKPGSYLSLFCAELSNHAGTQFTVSADAPDKLSWFEVYGVLNSVNKQ